MAQISKDELLIKIATILRLPRYNINDGCWAYDKAFIEEILNEIAAFFEQRR